MNDVAIRVQGLCKQYPIYENPRDRLKQFVLPRLGGLVGQAPKQYYREFWALRDISFEVKRGETVGIIGRNGSGKSTLLQIICGTLSPTSGTVETNGRIAALLELGSGFNPDFTGRENVYMNAAVIGLSRKDIDACYDDIVAFANIGDFIDQPVKIYSSGMFVRLAFAIAINVTPDVLVIDEALSVGDIRFQAKCMRAIQEIREKGAAILFVTHSPGQIEALCDRAIWLNEGWLKADGSPPKLMRNYVNFVMHGIDTGETDSITDVSEPSYSNESGTAVCEWVDITSNYNIKGDLSAVITKIKVRQMNEEPLSIVYAQSQKIRITILVQAHSDVFKPLLGIGIFNVLNEPVVHFNNENVNKKIEQLPANTLHTFDFTFNVPALRPGEYLISIGIDDGISGASRVLCHVYDAWSFSVSSHKDEKAQGGYIQIENMKEAITHNRGA